VARFLGLLELYRDGVVAFDQVAALAELRVRWTGPAAGAVDERDGDGTDDDTDDDERTDADEEYG
jgi:segregation and condensation protein A